MGTTNLGNILNSFSDLVSAGTYSQMSVNETGTIKFDAKKLYLFVNGEKIVYKISEKLQLNNPQSS